MPTKLETFFSDPVASQQAVNNAKLSPRAPNLEEDRSFISSKVRHEKFVPDSEDDAILNLAKGLNVKLDDSTKDYLMQYYLNENSAINAHQRNINASSTQYQRAVADLRKAGLNPFMALQSLSGSTPSSQAASVQGGLYTSRVNQSRQSGVQAMSSILGILGIIAAAFIHALI